MVVEASLLGDESAIAAVAGSDSAPASLSRCARLLTIRGLLELGQVVNDGGFLVKVICSMLAISAASSSILPTSFFYLAMLLRHLLRCLFFALPRIHLRSRLK